MKSNRSMNALAHMEFLCLLNPHIWPVHVKGVCSSPPLALEPEAAENVGKKGGGGDVESAAAVLGTISAWAVALPHSRSGIHLLYHRVQPAAVWLVVACCSDLIHYSLLLVKTPSWPDFLFQHVNQYDHLSHAKRRIRRTLAPLMVQNRVKVMCKTSLITGCCAKSCLFITVCTTKWYCMNYRAAIFGCKYASG